MGVEKAAKIIPKAAGAARELVGEAPSLLRALQTVLSQAKGASVDPAYNTLIETIGRIAASPKIKGILETIRRESPGALNPADIVQQGMLPYLEDPQFFKRVSPEQYAPKIEQSIMDLLEPMRPRVPAGGFARSEGYTIIPGAQAETGYINPEITKEIIPEGRNIWEGLGPLVKTLTDRQKQIAELLAEGKTSKEVGEALGRGHVRKDVEQLRNRLYRQMPEEQRKRIQAQAPKKASFIQQLEDKLLGVLPERAPERYQAMQMEPAGQRTFVGKPGSPPRVVEPMREVGPVGRTGEGAPAGILPEEWSREKGIMEAYQDLYKAREVPEMPRMPIQEELPLQYPQAPYTPKPKPQPSELDVLQRLHRMRMEQDPSYQALEELLRGGTRRIPYPDFEAPISP